MAFTKGRLCLCLFTVYTVITLEFGLVLTAPPNTLRQVNVLYRHGDRSPTSVYPKDIHRPSIWPDGYGWLTNVGMQQQYELGQFLKQRYDGFINTTHYNHKEITVKSSSIERCLMSAYSNLAGLFPPHGDQLWNPSIPWQPIPVQTQPLSTDNTLAEQASCPRFTQLKHQALQSPAIKKEEHDNKNFYEMVERETGVPQKSISDIFPIIGTLTCEEAHNLTWNSWVKPVWNKLKDLRALDFNISYTTPEMTRLKGGPLLKEILGNLDFGASGGNLPKFYMYSAHDTTVASLLSALKVYNNQPPIYRALVIVELHEINNVSVVKILYRNDTVKGTPYELTVPGCETPCTLAKLKQATLDHVPVNWTAECLPKNNVPTEDHLTHAILSLSPKGHQKRVPVYKGLPTS